MLREGNLRVTDKELLFKAATVLVHFKHLNALIQLRVERDAVISWMHLSDQQLSTLDALFKQDKKLAELVGNATCHPDLDDVLALSRANALTALLERMGKPHLKLCFDLPMLSNEDFQAMIKIPDHKMHPISLLLSRQALADACVKGDFSVVSLGNLRDQQSVLLYSRLLNPDVQLHLDSGALCIDEVLRVDCLDSKDDVDAYLQKKADKEKIYETLTFKITNQQKNKLCIFDVLFIRNSFGPSQPRAAKNVEDVVALGDEEADKLQHIIPSYLNIFFFTDHKMPISDITSLTKDERRFIDSAIMMNNEDLIKEMRSGRFREIYNAQHDFVEIDLHSHSPVDEESPLVSLESRMVALIQSLQVKLKDYIEKIESHRNANNPVYPDFSYGFRFFICWQAVNRAANYCLAKSLHEALSDDTPDIADLFSKESIRSLRFKEGKPSPNHGIRSDDLNAIIKEAREFISRHHRVLYRQ